MKRPLAVPQRLVKNCEGYPERMEWLRSLPETVVWLQERWAIRVGQPFDEGEGSCAWVAPARRADGSEAVLKLAMPHDEAEHEIDALTYLAGDPTAELYEADRERWAMLLERCVPGTSLRRLPQPEQDEVIAGLLRRFWRELNEPHPFRPLSHMTVRWTDQILARRHAWRDAGLVQQALELLALLPHTAKRQVLLATDLHAGNVLRAARRPWLVIDPKPFVGDPAYDGTQHLLNCVERLRADPTGLIHRFSDLLEVEEERLRLWTFARVASESFDAWAPDVLDEIARALAPR